MTRSHRVIEMRTTRPLLERGGHSASVSVAQADLKSFMKNPEQEDSKKISVYYLRGVPTLVSRASEAGTDEVKLGKQVVKMIRTTHIGIKSCLSQPITTP
jgi:hypothetical protein